MRTRDVGRRLLVSLTVPILLGGCGVGVTPSLRPAPPAVSTPGSGSGPTGSMTAAHVFHASTVLADGRVLVAGGFDPSAELYDPTAGSFSRTGPMTAARAFETATLLPDGNVLVTGGLGSSSVLASAELFDPSTDTFRATGSMATPRYQQIAARLADGRVLVAGGEASWVSNGALASAELYDARTGSFSPTGSMGESRAGAGATLLADGRVLITGGFSRDGSPCLASAEIYEPTSGTFHPTVPMSQPRCSHTATLLADGRVLITGGGNGLSADGQDSAEIFDPKTSSFGMTGSMTAARRKQAAALLPDGRVLVAGGEDGSRVLASAELFDPRTGTFSMTGSMATMRFAHSATLLADGRVLVTGGCIDAGSVAGPYLASAELFDPKSSTFSPTGRSRLSTVGQPADDGARIVSVAAVDARTRDLAIDSPAVGGIVEVRLLVPTRFNAQPSSHWPVLELLHDSGGSHLDWTANTDVEALTTPMDLLIVMPDAGSMGFYSDWWNGGMGGPPRWETFHLVDLLQLLERNWHASNRRAIAGVGMGGYGAVEYAARRPGTFLAAASFSGTLDPLGGQADLAIPPALWGDPAAQADVWTAHDPTSNAEALKGTALYVAYGNGRPAYPGLELWTAVMNQTFVRRLTQLQIPATVDAYGPDTYGWPTWQRDLHRSLPLLRESVGG
jgi:S-formylglutathione hydrolase FrmB